VFLLACLRKKEQEDSISIVALTFIESKIPNVVIYITSSQTLNLDTVFIYTTRRNGLRHADYYCAPCLPLRMSADDRASVRQIRSTPQHTKST
jgi:hypothetical protein